MIETNLYDIPSGEVALIEHDDNGFPYAVLWGSEADRLAEDDDAAAEGYDHTTGSLSGYDTLAELLEDLPGATPRECTDGCGLDVDHSGPCRECSGGRILSH